MRTPCKPNEIVVCPIVNSDWWNRHVSYSKFRRQGLDIICASFVHTTPVSNASSSSSVANASLTETFHKAIPVKANIIFITGLTESFVKYSELLQHYYEEGFNVFTYDHQSQGLSGRWLTESQSLWIHTFEDYVDDFVYFVTTISKESPPHTPMFLVAHSMGGCIAGIAMARLPSLLNRAVFSAPMIRNKCGMKYNDFKYPLPQPLAYGVSMVMRYLGLGTKHALGFLKEKPTDKVQCLANVCVAFACIDVLQVSLIN